AVKELVAITGTFKDNLVAWLGDAMNGIEKLFAKEVHTEKLCVKKNDGSEICVTGDQLSAVLNGIGTTVGGPSGGGSTIGNLEIVPPDDSTACSTENEEITQNDNEGQQ